jgi:iron complex outermembrane recepter protein
VRTIRSLAWHCSLAAGALALSAALPGAAHAQRVSQNAVTEADDAFGSTVGIETTGIYTEQNTRGFNPRKAGNVRIEGIYFDQAGALSNRLKQSTTIRVGFAAEDFPFPAPTGVVDNRLYPMPTAPGASLGLHSTAYGGYTGEFDLRLPVVKDHVGLNIGADYSDHRPSDGTRALTADFAARAIVRYAHTEFAPFIMLRWFPKYVNQTLVVVNGDTLPEHPATRRYLGQRWADGKFDAMIAGATLKSRLSDHFVFRSGLFRAGGARISNFTEVYSLLPGEPPPDRPCGVAGMAGRTGDSCHFLIADPYQTVWSTSGEAQAVYLADSGKWHHRVYLGYRFRDRETESGGSDFFNFGLARYGVPDPLPEPDFDFTDVNLNRVKQSAIMLGYIGRIDGRATVNLGIQKSRYRALSRNGVTGDLTRSRANPWLYNATLDVELLDNLSIYVGAQRGLEDSGNAPDTAANRLAQLPTTKTTQYEGGIHWRFRGGQLFVNVFELSKPYFTFDAGGVFKPIADVTHRGVEASLSGQFGKRLHVVAGAVVMRPRVSGEARELGLVGKLPTGTPAVYARLDANYRTDILGGLTPIATLEYASKQAVSAGPIETLGGRQLMTPSYFILDLGLRHRFDIGSVPASFRLLVNNVFDKKRWDIVAANTLQVDARRRLTLTLTADF